MEEQSYAGARDGQGGVGGRLDHLTVIGAQAELDRAENDEFEGLTDKWKQSFALWPKMMFICAVETQFSVSEFRIWIRIP